MLRYSVCAFLAPAVVTAAAFPWTGPEPTLTMPEIDAWSPAPTNGPKIGAIELLRRADDNTCGYISGDASQSLTCNNANYVCATNTYYGVHGCCNPNGISSCNIPTTCIPSSLLSASCTGDCSSNELVAKCTDSGQPSCYQWRYIYTDTIMTEFGCASSGFTVSVERTMSGDTSSLPSENEIPLSDTLRSATSSSESSSTLPASTSASATATSAPQDKDNGGGKKSNVGAIVGGVVGGLVVIGAIAFGIVFLILRNKKQKQNAVNTATGANQPFMGPAPGVTEYKPQPGGYPPHQGAYGENAGYFAQGNENKAWQGQQQPFGSPPTSPAPMYSGPAPMGPTGVPAGVAEAGGNPVPGHPQQHPHPQHQNIYEAP